MSIESPAYDVAILGGGLAGLTLALQLRRQDPTLRIVVFERHRHPVREAAFKVGESTVEIGAHYFSSVLGLREHLDAEQIRKFGFRFFFNDGREDIDRCTEVGVSRLLATPSWQIDRGRFENFLADHVRAEGVEIRDGTVVRETTLGAGENPHRVRCDTDGCESTVEARWLVDASGRAGLLKRKLGLAVANAHNVNAVWWRVDGHIDPHEWSDDAAWKSQCTPPDRWRSTNHLCGPGYWVWLIPLSSGAHSVGIVADAAMHPLDTLKTHALATDWLRRHQPQLARTLERPGHAVQDFLFLRKFSYGCKQLFSAGRWALTGEAGVFLDPFYSPGSDFIAISNTYICDLIRRDRAGERIGAHAALYEQLFFSFYENTLSLYQDQYALFGDARVMPVKVIWDYTFYWSLLAPLYFADRLTDVALLGRLRPVFAHASALNGAMQPLLREWGARNAPAPPSEARTLDQYRIDWFRELNRGLNDPLDEDALFARLQSNTARMQALATEILGEAHRCHPDIGGHALQAVLGAAASGAVEAPDAPQLEPHWYALT